MKQWFIAALKISIDHLRSCINTYHSKAVANPEATPSTWTVWYVGTLTVDSYDISWYITHNTPTDVWLDFQI